MGKLTLGQMLARELVNSARVAARKGDEDAINFLSRLKEKKMATMSADEKFAQASREKFSDLTKRYNIKAKDTNKSKSNKVAKSRTRRKEGKKQKRRNRRK